MCRELSFHCFGDELSSVLCLSNKLSFLPRSARSELSCHCFGKELGNELSNELSLVFVETLPGKVL